MECGVRVVFFPICFCKTETCLEEIVFVTAFKVMVVGVLYICDGKVHVALVEIEVAYGIIYGVIVVALLLRVYAS